MSGPKDYTILFSAARLLAQSARISQDRRRRQEALQRRAASNRARLAEEAARLERKVEVRREQESELKSRQQTATEIQNRQIDAATSRLEMENSKNSSSRDKRLVRKAKENQARLDKAQAELSAESERDAPELESLFEPGLIADASDKMVEMTEALNTSNSDDSVKTKVQEAFFSVLQWKEELNKDEDVADFQSTESLNWSKQLASSLNDIGPSDQNQILTQAESLIKQAQQIHDKAGELAAKYNTRNELIGDIIASLKEVGFVVNDPIFRDINDPTSGVVLVASRGNERMVADIDLSDEIRSTWDNVSNEHCRTGFFAYVDAMSKKGVEVNPHREDLRQRPIRIQKGAKDLPRKNSDNA